MNCCDHNCRQGRDCPNRSTGDRADWLVYAAAGTIYLIVLLMFYIATN